MFLGDQPRFLSQGGGGAERPRNFLDLLHARTQYEKQWLK